MPLQASAWPAKAGHHLGSSCNTGDRSCAVLHGTALEGSAHRHCGPDGHQGHGVGAGPDLHSLLNGLHSSSGMQSYQQGEGFGAHSSKRGQQVLGAEIDDAVVSVGPDLLSLRFAVLR